MTETEQIKASAITNSPVARGRLYFLTPGLLIGANIIPLLGVLFWDWSVFNIMMLFWFENVAIGVINVFKMISFAALNKSGRAGHIAALFFMVPFFSFHYGMFTMVHGLFIITMFGAEAGLNLDGQMMDSALLISAMAGHEGLIYGAIGLFVSHFLSYLINFIAGREYEGSSLDKLMAAPYGRVVILHITILIGGMAALAISGGAVWALALLIILKTALDLTLHLRAHDRLKSLPTTNESK